jgi:CHAT domain-containing protein/tetratricopeptide (TPR) repeat protein
MYVLGRAYRDRNRGDRAANLEMAISCFDEALEIRTRDVRPDEWATTMVSLGNSYANRILGDRASNLKEAIGCYKQALEIQTREAKPIEWAGTMQNLGVIYSDRIWEERTRNLEMAIDCYQKALETYTRESTPIDWAGTMRNLGNVYADRIRGERASNVEEAIRCYEHAMEVFTGETMPQEHRRTQFNLGTLYIGEMQWEAAAAAYTAALETGGRLYQATAAPEDRQSMLSDRLDSHLKATYALAKAGNYAQAVEILEAALAWALSESLDRSEAVLKQTTDADRRAFIAARKQIAVLEAEARSLDQPGSRDCLEVSADLRQARDELGTIVERIRGYLPEFMPQGLSFPAISQVARDARHPLVYLLTTSAGSLALLVLPAVDVLDENHIIWLSDFTQDRLNAVLYDYRWLSGYLYAVIEADQFELTRALDELWQPLTGDLVTPITDRMCQLGYSSATLIATGTLDLLPLEALALDELTLSRAPSARSLQVALNAAEVRSKSAPVLLGIGNPLPNPHPLPFAHFEVDEVASLFAVDASQIFTDHAATVGRLHETLPDATILHFACHGIFDPGSPLDSELQLAGEDRVTLRGLLDGDLDLSTVRLAVLSACQTGIMDFQRVPDEAIGFPAGFLQAGVPGVVSTLWPVNDLSTALLMGEFYRRYIIKKQELAEALRGAQLWLRNSTAQELDLAACWERHYRASGRRDVDAYHAMRYFQHHPDEQPFAHPYYWAAFTFTGTPYRGDYPIT